MDRIQDLLWTYGDKHEDVEPQFQTYDDNDDNAGSTKSDGWFLPVWFSTHAYTLNNFWYWLHHHHKPKNLLTTTATTNLPFVYTIREAFGKCLYEQPACNKGVSYLCQKRPYDLGTPPPPPPCFFSLPHLYVCFCVLL